MKRLPPRPTELRAETLELIYELLDAHDDTAQLAAGFGDIAWQLHLDYLRVLQRKGRELLAWASAAWDQG